MMIINLKLKQKINNLFWTNFRNNIFKKKDLAINKNYVRNFYY